MAIESLKGIFGIKAIKKDHEIAHHVQSAKQRQPRKKREKQEKTETKKGRIDIKV